MKTNTIPIRSHKEFKKLLDNILDKKPRNVKTARITLAIANQYKKYPQLLKELLSSNLK